MDNWEWNDTGDGFGEWVWTGDGCPSEREVDELKDHFWNGEGDVLEDDYSEESFAIAA